MSGLKEIRNRISSVSSTMQITNAMKMVSAAKLKKAQDSISATLPYSNKLSELIKNISASTESDDTNPLFEKRESKNVLIIAITSNKVCVEDLILILSKKLIILIQQVHLKESIY